MTKLKTTLMSLLYFPLVIIGLVIWEAWESMVNLPLGLGFTYLGFTYLMFILNGLITSYIVLNATKFTEYYWCLVSIPLIVTIALFIFVPFLTPIQLNINSHAIILTLVSYLFFVKFFMYKFIRENK